MPFNITIPNEDVDYGATPDRTNKAITLRMLYGTYLVNNNIDATGLVADFQVPVTIEVYVRDSTATAKRIEPPKLIQIEKYIVEHIVTNKYSLQDEGINTIRIQNSQKRPVDSSEYDVNNWWLLTVNVLMHYWLRYTSS